MRSEEEIEIGIKSNFPLLFDLHTTDDDKFREKFKLLTENISKFVGPHLGPETLRYQSMILYFSIGFIFIKMLGLSFIDYPIKGITVDSRFLIFCATFMVAIIFMFSSKASLNYKMGNIERLGVEVINHDILNLIQIQNLKKNIEDYYFNRILNVVQSGQTLYSKTKFTVADMNQEPETVDFSIYSPNISDDRQRPELKESIASLDEFEQYFSKCFEEEKNKFEKIVLPILDRVKNKRSQAQYVDPIGPLEEIDGHYKTTLKAWWDVADRLNSSRTDTKIIFGKKSPFKRSLALYDFLSRAYTMRKSIFYLEVALPIVFGIFSTLYLTFG